MTLSRGYDWSQSLVSSFFIAAFLVVGGSQSLRANPGCGSLLDEVEHASMRPLFRFQPEANQWLMPKMKAVPSHASSSMVTRFMYFIQPGSGNDYAVIEKSSVGFGFSHSTATEYELVESANLQLVDLQANGNNTFFTSAIVSVKSPQAIVLKLTVVEDSETGKLKFADIPGLAIPLKGQGKDVRLAARPGTFDYWMVDKSGTIRVIGFNGKNGFQEVSTLEAEEFLGKDPTGSPFVSVEAIKFLSNGSVALVTAKAANGNRYAIPILITETEVKKPELKLEAEALAKNAGGAAATAVKSAPAETEEPQIEISYNSFPENAFALEADEKLTLRDDKDLILLVGQKKVRALSLSLENLGWSELLNEDLAFVGASEILVDFNFYWDGALVQTGKGKNAKVSFQGDLKAYAVVYDSEKAQSRVIWLVGGNSAPTSPTSHSGVGPK